MAKVNQISSNHWEVHLASEEKSEVTIEVHMSRSTAERLVELETARVSDLNPGRTDLPAWSPGTAVLNVLGLYAANGHIK